MADLTRPRFVKCARCGRRIKVGPFGRVPTYCGDSCKVMAYAKRRRVKQPTLPPPSDDERHRRFLWDALVQFGLASGPMPPPKPKPEDET